jgi:hypothetical protein
MDSTMTDWIAPTQATRKAQVKPACVTTWGRRYGLGEKVAGRWRVDPALDRPLTGAPACDGDRVP